MTTTPSARLDELSLGFRDRFLSYDELTRQVRAWADAFPDVCRLTSIGRTPEGRELWLLTLGPDPDRARPSAWVDGNMHASELCGSSVALAIAEDILRLHLRPGRREVRAELSATVDGSPARRPVLRAAADVARRRGSGHDDGPLRALHSARRAPGAGARALARRGRRRRRPGAVDARPRSRPAKWSSRAEFPGLLLPRGIDDAPPYYKVYPEGVIENFDGKNVPSPYFLSDNQTDLNRNFPYHGRRTPSRRARARFR